MPGTLFVVATPIGNLEDISARALRVLREVALIAAEDTRRTGHLLARYGITTRTTSLHEHNETARADSLLRRLHAGEDIALVSDAGTPTVSDPGGRLIRLAIDAGLRIEPVPGPSAAIAALSVSGLPTESFTFMGFPPTRSSDRVSWFEQVRSAGRTVVFYESPHRIQATLQQLHSLVGDIQVCVGRELTKAHETLVRGPISVVVKALVDAPGEFTVVADVGHMAHVARQADATPEAIGAELGELTNTPGTTRRKAITILARRHGKSPNEIYDLLEQAKRSVD